jgi:hypothetical protein
MPNNDKVRPILDYHELFNVIDHRVPVADIETRLRITMATQIKREWTAFVSKIAGHRPPDTTGETSCVKEKHGSPLRSRPLVESKRNFMKINKSCVLMCRHSPTGNLFPA